MEERAAALAERLRAELGGALRAVAIGDVQSETYEIGYMREDVRDAYAETDREAIFREIVMETIGKPQQARLFGELGEPRSTVRTFENGIYVIYWDADRFAFASFAPDVPMVPPVVRSCQEAFDSSA